MRRILLDGTTVMSAHRLLLRHDPPTALNVTSLALLVESIVLHEELVTLDTTAGVDFQDSDIAATVAKPFATAAETFGEVLRVERTSVRDTIKRYVTAEFPGVAPFFDDEAAVDKVKRGVPSKYHRDNAPESSNIYSARTHLYNVLHQSYYDPETVDYLKQIEDVAAQWRQRSWAVKYAERKLPVPSRTLHIVRWALTRSVPAADPHLDELMAPHEMQSGWEDFVSAYFNVGSPWYEAQLNKSFERSQFTPALLIRTHFYLLASEVFEAPYRPDVLRGPICWAFFGGSITDVSLEERVVDLAELVVRGQAEAVNELVGRKAFTALPLFLARIMRTSRRPSDIIPAAYVLRDSPAARRFRRHLAALSEAEEAGDIATLARELGRAAAMLREQYGAGQFPADVVWSLAGSAIKTAIAPSPPAAVDLGIGASKATLAAGTAAVRWWQRRKLALVSTTVKQALQAASLQHELSRAFGAPMSDDDLDFLARLQRIGAGT